MLVAALIKIRLYHTILSFQQKKCHTVSYTFKTMANKNKQYKIEKGLLEVSDFNDNPKELKKILTIDFFVEKLQDAIFL
mgnify:CR=1 FL=1